LLGKNYNSISFIIWFFFLQNSNIINIRYGLIIGIREKNTKELVGHYNTLLGVTCYLIKNFSEKMNGIFKPLRPIQM
jgi:hypothetical protein